MEKVRKKLIREKAVIAVYQYLLTNSTEEEIMNYLNECYKPRMDEREIELCKEIVFNTIERIDEYVPLIEKNLKKSWYIDAVKKAFDDGKLTYVGDYRALDYETIIAGAPTLAIFSTMLTSVPDVAEKLKELGINYILDQSTYEDHPLGRVEWAKLYAALCNEEDAATDMFNAQAAYVDTFSKAVKTGISVAVFYITSMGKLYVRNAGDYLAQMVNIAGGDYIFSDLNADKTGTQEMGIESFYEKAKDADYIIYVWNLGGKPSTLSDFTGYNSILADIKAVKDGNVWCTTPDFFQIADTIGSMINDINLMLNADADTSELTYLKKLK